MPVVSAPWKMAVSKAYLPGIIFFSLCFLGFPALAQRTDDNALRSADDAFGSSIGSETIGLYSPFDVRGFSPFDAGNVRLEGLYIDSIIAPNGRLVRGSNVRIGISAQGYPFPAPTGIADYRLRLPGDSRVVSAVVGASSVGGANAEFDAQIPIVPERLSFSGGASLSYDVPTYSQGNVHAGAAALLRWRPTRNLEILPFWSTFIHRGDAPQPRFIVAGDYLPPRIDRHADLAQPWAKNDRNDFNYGLITRWSLAGIDVGAGLFRSARENRTIFADQFLDTSPGGESARHRIVATPPNKSASTSGELRLSREVREGPRKHVLHLALRSRDQKRLYGGSAVAELGPAPIDAPAMVTRPEFEFRSQSRDRVSQKSAGLAYQGGWSDVGEITLGVQRSDYSKTVQSPGRIEPITRAKPWLYNGGLALHISESLAFYTSLTRGMEESPVAPDSAMNRDEAPPAILTRQRDAGLRWAITPDLRLVTGLFDVEKPYFSLDSARLYRRLGEVRHRGIEVSLVGEVSPNLSLLIGGVLLDAQVSGEAVDAGLVGRRPVGSTPRRITFNAEYRVPAVVGLSFDVAVNSFGKRMANTANSLTAPPAAFVNAGLRLRRTIGGNPMVLRLHVTNLLDEYSWQVQASNAFFYSAPRRFGVELTSDF